MRRTNHQLNPHFIRAIRISTLPGWKLALLAGFRHHSRFSNLLHAAAVPGSTAPLFERVAELVDFPPAQIFVTESSVGVRLVKRAGRSARRGFRVTDTFSAWLLRQAERDDPVGDLARDAAADPDFPQSTSTRSLAHIEAYLQERGLSNAVDALNKAIREWNGEAGR